VNLVSEREFWSKVIKQTHDAIIAVVQRQQGAVARVYLLGEDPDPAKAESVVVLVMRQVTYDAAVKPALDASLGSSSDLEPERDN
jgi:hypothetical protein